MQKFMHDTTIAWQTLPRFELRYGDVLDKVEVCMYVCMYA